MSEKKHRWNEPTRGHSVGHMRSVKAFLIVDRHLEKHASNLYTCDALERRGTEQ